MNNNNYHVAWCPFCNQGWVNIVKDALGGQLFLLCNECDTLWSSPNDLKSGNPIISKIAIKIEEPLLDEIKMIGWDKVIMSMEDL